jgi:hypothetical protein
LRQKRRLAHVIVSRYCDHLPLHPQSRICARAGVTIDRSVMAGWVGSADRTSEHAHTLLKGCRGHLHADGYTGFGGLYEVDPKTGAPAPLKEVACWAHARRKIYDAHIETKSPAAAEALDIPEVGLPRSRAAQLIPADRRVGIWPVPPSPNGVCLIWEMRRIGGPDLDTLTHTGATADAPHTPKRDGEDLSLAAAGGFMREGADGLLRGVDSVQRIWRARGLLPRSSPGLVRVL